MPWAHRWRTTNVCDVWPVWRQTYGYLHQPLAGTKLYCLVTEAHVGCTRQWGGQDSNPWPVARKSSVPTTPTLLQSIQNAVARLVTGTWRRDHITPVLRDLHWLPVRRRVIYKLALLVYKSMHGLAPLPCWLLHPGFLWRVSPPSMFGRRGHMHRPEDPYPFWRLEFLRCRPLDLEQLTSGSAAARHWARRIPLITEDIFVCLGTAETAAH